MLAPIRSLVSSFDVCRETGERKEGVEIIMGKEKKSFDIRGAQRFKSGNSSRTVMLELIREYEWNFKRKGEGAGFYPGQRYVKAQPRVSKKRFFPPVDQPFPNFHRDNFFPRGTASTF